MTQAPRDIPEFDPDTLGQENPISMSTDKSIGITFCVWTIIPRDDLFIQKSNASRRKEHRTLPGKYGEARIVSAPFSELHSPY